MVEGIPPALAVTILPPALNVNVPVEPFKTDVPKSTIAPLLIVKLIALEIVPLVLENAWLDVPVKLMAPLPPAVSVIVAPLKVKSPAAFSVPAAVPVDISRVPPLRVISPVTVTVRAVLEPILTRPADCEKLPAIVLVPGSP